MIIGIDAGCLGITDERLKVGVYRMSVGLLCQLFKIDKKNFYRLYSFSPIDNNLLKLFGKRVVNKVIIPPLGWMKIWLPLELRRHPVDIFLGLSQSLPVLPQQTKGILFVHDLTFERYPQWFINSYKKMSDNSKFAVKQAEKIIAVSEATKNDLINLYKIKDNKIKVIYEGFSQNLIGKSSASDKKIKNKFSVKKPFILFVGTLKPSKNVPNIIRAFYKFNKKYSDYQLVICGSNYWLDTEINNMDLNKNIKLLGFVSDEVLSSLYSNAEIFISPSFNEGFGLTYLEAANFSLPIIASKRGSVREILGEGAYYVDPFDVAEIEKALEKLVVDKKLRNKIISLAKKNIQKFSWENSAYELLALIKSYEKK